MALSSSTNYSSNRDQLITRALRICNEVGTGETVSAARITETALVLNDIFKEWQALGMEMWKRVTIPVTLTANTGTYTIGIGSTINTTAPTKVLDAWTRNTSTSVDVPMVPLTRDEYDAWNNKSTNGTPTQWYYNPPGAIAATEMQGTLYVLDRPTTAFAAAYTIQLTGLLPLMDFDASADVPDVPSYLFNSLVWALAEQLCYEAGVPLAERSMISKMADKHLARAMSFDIEEGSIYFQPDPQLYEDGVVT